jgi:omega-6 fatty acid desaturase (delta-12 desaturase)
VIGTNAAIAALVTAMALTVGLGPFLLAFLPVSAIGAAVGVWLFYVQHQFEDTYWSDTQHWSFRAAAMEGCSYYDLPRVLHWFTGHIGLHHIHHLSSRIPNYRLRACYERHTEFHAAKRLTLWDSFRCARLALWDEDRRKLVSFRDARATA